MDGRTRFLAGVFGLVFLLILGRVVFLTAFMGKYYRSLAADNRVLEEGIEAQRGRILDRNGKVLAESVKEDGSFIRFYPFGEILAHVVGYVNFEGQGVVGLEESYDKELAGVAGEVLFEAEARGKVREMVKIEALPGKDIKTNLDFELQKAVYLVLRKKLDELGLSEGVVVISKINGEVLSLVSLPAFDPNLFVGADRRGEAGGNYSRVEQILSDEEGKPLFDRAVAGAYAPGSVYKLVPAVAGLSEGVIDGDFLVEDEGEIKIGEERFGNWYFDQYGRMEGRVGVVKALARSNDIFFYKLGEMLGEERLISWSRMLGLGEKTGIDLGGEVAGLVPDPLWREKTFGSRWYLGNTYHMAIGQGDLLTTPLQINRMTASVVSGKKCRPVLVNLQGGRALLEECEDLGVGERAGELVLEGMRRACSRGEDYKGTAFPFFDVDKTVYCKTGTAQQGGEGDEPHAWITVVVPRGEEILDWVVMTVMLPAGGEGSSEAGPVAKEIVDYLIEDAN